MQRILISIILFNLITLTNSVHGQNFDAKFGKGIQILGKDSTFQMKAAFRIQNLFSNEWTLENDELGNFTDHEAAFLIRRSRFKFDGWAYTPKLKYKFEIGLSNRDISGGGPETRNANRLILDAFVEWNFYKNFSLKVGQAKLPGNRERVISSANLQFVDRSRLNSRYNIDRDMGIQLKHKFKIDENFVVKENISFSQGEGRNITEGHFGGFEWTFRLEFLPFGEFVSKGDYVGSAVKSEEKPKLAIGFTYDINNNAVRTRGQNGSFIQNLEGEYFGKTLNTIFIDAMFKYKGFSFMGEYVDKATFDEDPLLIVDDNILGIFYTGSGLNLQAGWMFDNNIEIAARYTEIKPDEVVDTPEKQYTLGISKFIVGHKLKVQTDFTLRSRDERDDNFIWRTQVDIHF